MRGAVREEEDEEEMNIITSSLITYQGLTEVPEIQDEQHSERTPPPYSPNAYERRYGGSKPEFKAIF